MGKDKSDATLCTIAGKYLHLSLLTLRLNLLHEYLISVWVIQTTTSQTSTLLGVCEQCATCPGSCWHSACGDPVGKQATELHPEDDRMWWLCFALSVTFLPSISRPVLAVASPSPSEIFKLSLSRILEYLQIDSVPLCTIRSIVAQPHQNNTAALKEAPWPLKVSLELNNEHSTHLASNLHSITIQDGPGSVLAVLMQDGFVHMRMTSNGQGHTTCHT